VHEILCRISDDVPGQSVEDGEGDAVGREAQRPVGRFASQRDSAQRGEPLLELGLQQSAAELFDRRQVDELGRLPAELNKPEGSCRDVRGQRIRTERGAQPFVVGQRHQPIAQPGGIGGTNLGVDVDLQNGGRRRRPVLGDVGL